MKQVYVILLTVMSLLSCSPEKTCTDCETCGVNLNMGVDYESPMEAVQMSEKEIVQTKVDAQEFEENKVKIEKKYGEQWDFCHCVLVNDSIDKLIKKSNLSDEQLDKVLERLDVVEKKCQAFNITDPSRTPEDREKHEKKIRNCLKEAKRN